MISPERLSDALLVSQSPILATAVGCIGFCFAVSNGPQSADCFRTPQKSSIVSRFRLVFWGINLPRVSVYVVFYVALTGSHPDHDDAGASHDSEEFGEGHQPRNNRKVALWLLRHCQQTEDAALEPGNVHTVNSRLHVFVLAGGIILHAEFNIDAIESSIIWKVSNRSASLLEQLQVQR